MTHVYVCFSAKYLHLTSMKSRILSPMFLFMSCGETMAVKVILILIYMYLVYEYSCIVLIWLDQHNFVYIDFNFNTFAFTYTCKFLHPASFLSSPFLSTLFCSQSYNQWNFYMQCSIFLSRLLLSNSYLEFSHALWDASTPSEHADIISYESCQGGSIQSPLCPSVRPNVVNK